MGKVEQAVERVVAGIVRRRLVVGAAALLLTLAAAASASKVEVEGSIEQWFRKDDASLGRYHAFRDRFGADEFVLVVAWGDALLAPGGLQAVERIRVAAEALPQVARTRWLTNATVAEATSDDVVEVGPLCRTLPATADEARALFARAAARASTRGMTALSPPATAVTVELARGAQDVPGKLALIDGLRGVIARERGPLADVVITGPPAFDEAFVRHTERDLGRLGPLALALIFGVILVSLRRVGLALVPVAIVAVSVIGTIGAMAALGYRVGLVSGNLVCVLVAVGVAEGIHLASEYRHQGALVADRGQAIARAAAVIFVPCFFAMVTTVAGMASLVTSQVLPVAEFGWIASGGVLLAFLTSFVLGPVLLSFMAPGAPPPPAGASRWSRLARLSRRTVALVLGGTVLVVALASLVLVQRLEVGVNPVEYFRKDDPLRNATERVDAALGGTASVELQVEAPDTGSGPGFEDPARLARLATLKAALEKERGASYSQSILDPLEDMQRVWSPGSGPVPDRADLIAQYLLLVESEPDVARLLLPSHTAGRLSLRTQMSMTDKPLEVIARIEGHTRAPDLQTAALDVEVTGYVHLMASMYGYLLESQIESALLALPMIAFTMLLLLRRPSLVVLALIPNVVPLVVGLGLMAALGIRLDVGTVMVGSITLGLIVDDTTHLLVRLREHLAGARVEDVPQVLERTLAEVGPPMLAASLAFMAGFGALMFGSFLVNVYFGLLSTVVVLLALLCDLLITPCLVLALPGWFVSPAPKS